MVHLLISCTVYLPCQLIESICFLVCVSEPVLRPNISPLTHRGSGLMRYANIQIRSHSGLFHADRCNKISSPLRNTNVIYNHLCSDVFHSHYAWAPLTEHSAYFDSRSFTAHYVMTLHRKSNSTATVYIFLPCYGVTGSGCCVFTYVYEVRPVLAGHAETKVPPEARVFLDHLHRKNKK